MLTITILEQSPFKPLMPEAAGGAINPSVHSDCYLKTVFFIMHGFVDIVAFILKKPRKEMQTHKAAFVPLFTV